MSTMDVQTSGPQKNGIKRRVGMALAGISVIAVCLVARHYWGASAADAQQPEPVAMEPVPVAQPTVKQEASPTPATPQDQAAKVVATVNNEPITRADLARDCLWHYGKQDMESLVNKYLIIQECKRRNIVITQGDVNDEIQRMASKFGLPVDTWLKMLKQERGINPAQYAADIIWPTLALRRLAGERLQVTPKDIEEEFQRQYGEAVKARIIVLGDAKEAESVRAKAAANPADFGNLAKEHSKDVNSASLKGLIPPIRRHVGDEKIEQVAFQLKDGEVSGVIPTAGQYMVLKREGLLPPSNMRIEQLQDRLEEAIRDRKMRRVAHDIFRELQERAVVKNVFNDPVLREKMPGVAGIVNDHQVSITELGEMSIQRHGEEVLEGAINRRLIEQAVRKAKITITDADMDAEIARAAEASVKPKADGSPDVESWLKLVTEQQGISVEVYRRDAVWPSVAMRKLVAEGVKITEEDLQKGYEANYGPRVRCLAIVLNNLRRAQQVWEMARQRPTADFFGDLAEKYSIEPGSQALRGEVPPIQRHGGQPLLEKDAFALQAGEMSGIIDAGNGRFVLLFCLGRTEPVKVDFAQVRDLIQKDIAEKKMRIAMANYFDKLQEAATIDNYLANTSRSPSNKREPGATDVPKAAAERRAGSILSR